MDWETIRDIVAIADTPLTAYLLYLNWVLWDENKRANARIHKILYHVLRLSNSKMDDGQNDPFDL